MIYALVAVLFVVVGTLGFVWPRRDLPSRRMRHVERLAYARSFRRSP